MERYSASGVYFFGKDAEKAKTNISPYLNKNTSTREITVGNSHSKETSVKSVQYEIDNPKK